MRIFISILILLSGLAVSAETIYTREEAGPGETYFVCGIEQDGIVKELRYVKADGERSYRLYGFSHEPFDSKIRLADQIELLQQLHGVATRQVEVDTKIPSLYFGRPLSYTDVFELQCKAFEGHDEWKTHIAATREENAGRQIDYGMISDIMVEKDVYRDLDEFLAPLGYEVDSCILGRMMFFEKEHLEADGLKTSVAAEEVRFVPFPFFIELILRKAD